MDVEAIYTVINCILRFADKTLPSLSALSLSQTHADTNRIALFEKVHSFIFAVRTIPLYFFWFASLFHSVVFARMHVSRFASTAKSLWRSFMHTNNSFIIAIFTQWETQRRQIFPAVREKWRRKSEELKELRNESKQAYRTKKEEEETNQVEVVDVEWTKIHFPHSICVACTARDFRLIWRPIKLTVHSHPHNTHTPRAFRLKSKRWKGGTTMCRTWFTALIGCIQLAKKSNFNNLSNDTLLYAVMALFMRGCLFAVGGDANSDYVRFDTWCQFEIIQLKIWNSVCVTAPKTFFWQHTPRNAMKSNNGKREIENRTNVYEEDRKMLPKWSKCATPSSHHSPPLFAAPSIYWRQVKYNKCASSTHRKQNKNEKLLVLDMPNGIDKQLNATSLLLPMFLWMRMGWVSGRRRKNVQKSNEKEEFLVWRIRKVTESKISYPNECGKRTLWPGVFM